MPGARGACRRAEEGAKEITVARGAPSASDGRVAERDDRSLRPGTKRHERDSLPSACWRGTEGADRCLTNRRACLRPDAWIRGIMRRAIPWLGLLLLTISFVWFVRLPAPTHPAPALHNPSRAVRGRSWWCSIQDMEVRIRARCAARCMEKDLTLDVALRAESLLRADRLCDCLDARQRSLRLARRPHRSGKSRG